MKTLKSILLFIMVFDAAAGFGQFLSNLQASKNDALYTTYAAPPSRSHYKTDQGYHLQWDDDESGLEFISKEGPNLGIAFQSGKRLIFKLNELYLEPVVTCSYSDLVKYYYYPVKDFRVEVFTAVYSSETVIVQYRLINEGVFPLAVTALPYLYCPASDSLHSVAHRSYPDCYSFQLKKKRDGWMKEHDIPVEENFTGYLKSSLRYDSVFTWRLKNDQGRLQKQSGTLSRLLESLSIQKRYSPFINGITAFRTLKMQPGESTTFEVIVSLVKRDEPDAALNGTLRKAENDKSSQDSRLREAESLKLAGEFRMLESMDLTRLVKEDEQAYSRIPVLKFRDKDTDKANNKDKVNNKDKEMLYWSAFSLMRQCMMPPEGACNYNYYVFSREPRWGWGYGGQVFHESLAMMAYAYMDPKGAMNSQRIYMERQKPDGYINYRTGPYLNETIETDGKQTSSAPWFNYQNLEIFHITGDRQFLKEAYVSGKKFYRYYISNRDSNNNGLCEWGAHAELESVRDARVAVWDKVGWAAGFEGPDVNAMLVMEARSLSDMASKLGFSEESIMWREDALKRSALINKTMWDTETGFYYNVNKKDQSFNFHSLNDLKIKEIIGFLPLWAGVADKEKADLLLKKMVDTTEFWRQYGIPSLTAKSDYYCPIGYWNGPVWVQWQYLIYRGLRDYGYDELAGQLAGRVLDNMVYHLKKDHIFWEFYSADDRQAGWNNTYIWAGIAARFLIDAELTQ